MAFLRRARRERGLRIFFATDLHGSDQGFRKFLNAGNFYDVQHLILGGDLTGKMIVPIRRDSGGRYSCTYVDQRYEDLDEGGRAELEKTIRRFGHYPVAGSDDELAELDDPDRRDAMFRRVVARSVADWVELAESRLRGSGRLCYVAPGNDDFFEIDDSLRGSDIVVFAEDRCLQFDDRYDMITTGYSNPTPWHTPRELPEEELKAKIDRMAREARGPDNLICVLHAPPYDSALDSAPKLDDELRPSMGGGGMRMTAVGSTAVREFIEEQQPLIGLHGHVHEGGGVAKIGRTLCLNPGSSYQEGVLMGAIVELGDGKVISHQYVSG